MSRAMETVDRQIDAYNAHDVDAFCACYAADAVIVDGEGTVLMGGIEAIRTGYADLFRRLPSLSVAVEQRLTTGDWVVDREVATSGAPERRSAVAVYRVRDERIDRVILLT